jgi:hypothetical protein
MSEIRRGDAVVVRDAWGKRLRRRALSGITEGRDFPVIWVCREQEWDAASAEDRRPVGVPWPVEDVELADETVGL